MLLLLISLLAGALTVLAPCVLPLLPVIVSGSLNGKSDDRARPYAIAVSLAASLIIFTLLLKVSTVFIGLTPAALTAFSGGLLIALGLVTAVPEIWEQIVVKARWQPASLRFLGSTEHNRGRLVGPILIGVALGPVFSSCSPTYAFILASVLPRGFESGLIYLVAYAVGLVVALLALALTGRKILSRIRWAVDTHSLFRRLTGVLFALVGLAVITGAQISIETWVANHLPFDEANIEQVLLRGAGTTKSQAPSANASGAAVLNASTPEPQLVGLTNWINSKPLTLAQLRGHVVLVDFWTYSCINCIRSLPYVERWYQTYQDKGLVIIGVSTPEFAFEHVPSNVAAAVKKDGIAYPVALDNNYDTWNAFNNDSWPADYLIDKTGTIRYISLGEGGYNSTEQAIQYLLGINAPLQTSTFNVPVSSNQSPETYFGTNREQDFQGSPSLSDGTFKFSPASNVSPSGWTLSGSWKISPEYITSNSASSTLTFSAQAKDVYMVAGSPGNAPHTVDVTLSGGAAGAYGADDPAGQAVVSGSRLYHIVSLPQMGSATVKLMVPAGVSLYTFTFGS